MPLSALLYETVSAWEWTYAVMPVPFVGLVPGAYVTLEKWI